MNNDNKEISYTFPSENAELIEACIRDLTTHDWELTSRIDELGCTTLTFLKK